MSYVSRRTAAGFLAIALTIPFVGSVPAVANGGNTPKEYAKYLNPFQKKGYLNQSQDRVIKKTKLKTQNMPVAAQQIANPGQGIFAVIPSDKTADLELVDTTLANPKVNGVSILVPWSQIQTGEEQFDWRPVDNVIASAAKAGKTVILRVSACGVDLPDGDKQVVSDIPKFVLDSGIKTIKYTDPAGRARQMPLFWDKDYLAKWSNFVIELADRYDKNPTLHSIGITGGGFQGGTSVVPGTEMKSVDDKGAPVDLNAAMKSQYGMTQRELVTHWKYTADLFPKHFKTARLNFNINAPVRGRAGEDSLDEIADYLIYRYGQRIYVTRNGFEGGRHKFDDYRLLVKFRGDTLTGVQFPPTANLVDFEKASKNALDDGVSFVEVPLTVLNSKDAPVQTALDNLATHVGFQLVKQSASLPDKIAAGQPVKASFSFVNVGAAPALRPERMFDKDAPSSYRIQLEFRDADGKPVLQNVHTPPTPTSKWTPGQTVTWDEELKMIDANKRQLPPGEYTAWLSIVDPNANRKIQFVNATTKDKPASADTVEVGKIVVTAAVEPKMEANAGGNAQGN